ncbi:hypothetical protein [Desertivirga xinjiangensis]|uniref:hypothetical protein n=1 Tax=Desertivirga xinjiangensis TaxID=539206 RepID=UPI00210DCC60|nr:hypothetical protein [Pedobacter xinjiangensis]
MKKIIYLLSLVLVAITACDPLEDTYNELDKTNSEKGYDLVVPLASADYSLLNGVSGAGNIVKNNNFNHIDSVKTFVPVILSKKFPQLGKGSSALVTYDYYNAIKIKQTASFTLTASDYTAIGINFPNLSSEAQILSAVRYKYPNPAQYDVVTLTYEYRVSGVTTTQTSRLVYIGDTWYIAFIPSANDYKAMAQNFSNFGNRTTAKENLGIYFGELFPYNKTGDTRAAIYVYSYTDANNVRHNEDNLVIFKYDGAKWLAVEDVTKQTLQFGHDGGQWVPDNTIKLSLASSDYTAIGALVTNEAAKASITRYGNFDKRLSSDEDIIKYLGAWLKSKYPASEVGQKYLITFKTFNPSGTEELHLILNASGAYEEVE